MHPLESLETVRNVLQQLMDKPEPLVRQIAPAPGSRAERYEQLLAPGLHETGGSAETEVGEVAHPVAEGAGAQSQSPSLAQRVASLEGEVAMLRAALSKLASEIGASDPLGPAGADDASPGGQAS
jgi:uncharacterized protein YceH (UPF0502 family)